MQMFVAGLVQMFIPWKLGWYNAYEDDYINAMSKTI